MINMSRLRQRFDIELSPSASDGCALDIDFNTFTLESQPDSTIADCTIEDLPDLVRPCIRHLYITEKWFCLVHTSPIKMTSLPCILTNLDRTMASRTPSLGAMPSIPIHPSQMSRSRRCPGPLLIRPSILYVISFACFLHPD